MKNITENSIGGLGEFFSPPVSEGDNTSPDTQTVNTEEITADEPAQTEAEAITGFDFGGILGGENGEKNEYTNAPPAAPEGKTDVQMPVALLAILIAAVCILGVIIIFLIAKMKKSKKNPAMETQIPAPAYPVNTNVNQNSGGSQQDGGEIKSAPEKAEEEKAGNMYKSPNIPVTVAPENAYPKHKFSYEIGNVHNQGKREEQQDSFCISDVSNISDLESKGIMAVVADGMGGLESGASVSQLVSNIFLNKYRSNAISDSKSFLYEAVMESEREVEKYIEVNHVDGGSTLVAVVVRDGLLNFISVGDSFIFLIRAGKLIKLNTEHTYGNLLRERAAKGEIDPEEAEINPKRASLTSYIGIGNLRLINQNNTPIPLSEGDILFLCSDGVYNALGDNALLEVVTGGDFDEAAERVEQSVLMQNIPTQDNFTAVMIKITGGK